MPLYLGQNMVSGVSLGVPGKSAYDAALEANPELGLTEEEFGQQLAEIGNKVNQEYVDQKISEIPTPDVSGQIGEHNTSDEAHSDIRTAVSNAANAAANAASAAANAQNAASTAQSTADSAANAAANAQTAAQNAQAVAESKAPMYTYGTVDLTPGVSPLETGKLYFVYE